MIKKDSNLEYHSKKEYISSSGVKKYEDCPAEYKHYVDNFELPEPESALDFGTAYHTMILEPEIFDQEVYVFDKENRPEPTKTMGSTANKTWKAEIIEKYRSANYAIISKDQYDTICTMIEIVKRHPAIKPILSDPTGKAEQSYYIEDYPVKLSDNETYNLKMKVRPDYETDSAIYDFKTAVDASYNGFAKAIGNLNYDTSAAMYQKGVEYEKGILKPFLWIVQKKTPPYSIALYLANEKAIQDGSEKFNTWIANHALCLKSNFYPDYYIYGVHIKGYKHNGMIPICAKYNSKPISLINQYAEATINVKPIKTRD